MTATEAFLEKRRCVVYQDRATAPQQVTSKWWCRPCNDVERTGNLLVVKVYAETKL
jgi:hypothetical protein